MTWWYLLALALATLNAARIRPALPEQGGRHVVRVTGAAGIVFVLGATATAWADPMLNALAISPETWRIGAGIVALLAGVWVLLFPARRREAGLPGSGAMLVPIAFPLILSPELAGFLVLFGATEPAAAWWPALAVGLASVPAAAAVRLQRTGLWAATSRMAAALLVVLAVAQIVEGIRDV